MTPPFLQSAPGAEPVVLECSFNTSAARLFRAWITPEEIKQWFGTGAEGPISASIDAKPGGAWEFAFAEKDGVTESLSGKYIDVIANELLRFTWQHRKRLVDGTIEKTDTSLVTVQFTALENATRLHLTHQRIVKASGRLGVGAGWSVSCQKLAGHIGVIVEA
ncbi:MAG: SRPBCC domain-containing protein [Pseudomonadota bacterium]